MVGLSHRKRPSFEPPNQAAKPTLLVCTSVQLPSQHHDARLGTNRWLSWQVSHPQSCMQEAHRHFLILAARQPGRFEALGVLDGDRKGSLK